MRAVIQRVTHASVSIDGAEKAAMGEGLLILLGVTHGDGEKEADYLAAKCAGLRIFRDSEDKMNRSVTDVGGQALVVSQFTLYSDCRKGKRPAFVAAARPETAIPLYERFVAKLREMGLTVGTGQFGADMQVSLLNNGPVTILMDTDEMMKKQEPEK
ncbi:MAG: D-tyrosyl-tRNA(Tyr) deacylase [Angelakisella sp.]|jgi:D-tyrosyl-tRNA(Tyr) deacylase|nr:D-tyrosyl-tRNA(Tyr) deacylase [Angelakisella sp.]